MVLYSHLKLDTDAVFYIGIGSKERPYSKSGRSKEWRNIVESSGYRVMILLDGLSKDEAFYYEKLVIRSLGRESVNNGLLVNKSSGGSGVAGMERSIESRIKMSNTMKGRSFSEDHKRAISSALSGTNHYRFGLNSDENDFSKMVIDNSNGNMYSSIKDAAESLGIKYSTLRCYINGQRKNKTTLNYYNDPSKKTKTNG